MRRLRPSASTVALVVLSLVATSLPRDAWYAHRHDGDAHGHVHAPDGSHVGRSSVSVRDFLGHRHENHHEHDHEHGHPHPHHEHDVTRHAEPAEHASAVARATSDDPSIAAPAGGLHAHWQAPFQASAITTVRHDAPSSVRKLPRFPAPIAASVERALALRARAPPVSPV